MLNSRVCKRILGNAFNNIIANPVLKTTSTKKLSNNIFKEKIKPKYKIIEDLCRFKITSTFEFSFTYQKVLKFSKKNFNGKNNVNLFFFAFKRIYIFLNSKSILFVSIH